jgi:MFS family permease
MGMSCLILATSGCLGAFSVISDALRERFHWSFSEINLVNAIGNASLYLAYLGSGPIYDIYGERITMAVGMVTFTFGYLMIWISFRGLLSTNVAWISLYYFIAGFGSSAVYMVAIGANAHNFDQRILGIITGILLLFYGFSGTIYSQIYALWFTTPVRSDTDSYLLFTTLSILIINSIGILFVEKMSPNRKISPEPVVQQELATLPITPTSANEETPLFSEEVVSMTPKQILQSKKFWLYAWVCVLGQALTYMANVNAIVRSSARGASPEWYISQTTLQVTLCSVSQSIGRLLFGILSDVVARYHIDRTILLLISQVLLLIPPLVLSIVELTIDNTIILSICSVLVGLGFGATGGLFPSLTRTLFGPKYFGSASSFVLAGVPIGIFACNAAFGILYDQELAIQKNLGSTSDFCYGSKCFQGAHIFTASIQFVSLLLSMYLYHLR